MPIKLGKIVKRKDFRRADLRPVVIGRSSEHSWDRNSSLLDGSESTFLS
jgi:hypothetical protein